MSVFRRTVHHDARPGATLGIVLAASLALFACAPAEDAGADDADAAASGDPTPTAAPDGSPACRFTASGEELTGRASPPDSATVRIGDGVAKICYSAPSVRGREIMGGLVPFGEPWRMGANEPTTLHLTAAAEMGDGVRLAPGSYALYAIPGETEWTIVANSDPERWGTPISDEVRASDVGDFTVEPERLAEPVERMRITFESAEDGGAVAALEWERTRVSFPIRLAAEGDAAGG